MKISNEYFFVKKSGIIIAVGIKNIDDVMMMKLILTVLSVELGNHVEVVDGNKTN